MTIHIDEYGHIVESSKAKYKVTLQGSYYYSFCAKGYWHEIEKIEPPLPLKRILLDKPINN
jgi:hypothetical protein